MRKRVFYYSLQQNDSTAFWRSTGVLPFINSNEFELIDVSGEVNWNWGKLIGCSVFIMQRPFAPEHVQLLTLIKDMGIKIILDYDDDLLNVPDTNPTYFQYLQSKNSILSCLKIADEVWVSTNGVKLSYNHKNTHVIPNSHNDYIYSVSEKKQYNTNTKKCIYRGGGSHMADVYSISDKLCKTIQDNTDWTFTFIGDRYTYLEQRCGDNYHIVGGMTVMQYFKWYYNENNNLAIFPLVNNTFNEGKSNISWIEATYAGSAFSGNVELPEFKYTGFNIENISDLLNINQNIDLQGMNNKSWSLICDTLLLSKINKIRENRILENI